MRLFLFGNKISIKIEEYLNMCWFVRSPFNENAAILFIKLVHSFALFTSLPFVPLCVVLCCVYKMKCNSI